MFGDKLQLITLPCCVCKKLTALRVDPEDSDRRRRHASMFSGIQDQQGAAGSAKRSSSGSAESARVAKTLVQHGFSTSAVPAPNSLRKIRRRLNALTLVDQLPLQNVDLFSH